MGAALLLSALARPARADGLAIIPGPKEAQAAERAIVADPATHVEHGVILLEETDRDDNLGSKSQTTFHLRAKVLSNEGRDLANVEIPIQKGDVLKKWWGWSISPDGKVAELAQAELREQSVVKTGHYEERALKGVIPGVGPGSIIDYGYVLSGPVRFAVVEVDFQRPYAIRTIFYRWRPYDRAQGEYTLAGSGSKRVTVHKDGVSIFFEAGDMRPIDREPFMPPDSEVRTIATMYYGNGMVAGLFWTLVGQAIDNAVTEYGPKDKSLRLMLSQMAWPKDADLAAKTRSLYDWVGRNVRNSGAMSAEEFEMIGALHAQKKFSARTLLAERYGNPIEINLLYASFVRALGAEARLVLAADRTKRYWDPGIKSLSQFVYALVAVKLPGQTNEQAVIVDASSGLPFGELPWQVTGTDGLLATDDGYRSVALMPAMADRNVAETDVAVSFQPAGEQMTSTWSYVGRGQEGRQERAALRAAAGDERAKQLDAMCATGTWEARHAEAPDLDDRTAPFRLACDIVTDRGSVDPGTGRYAFSLLGPWWPKLVEFPEGSRRQPIVFPFPKTEVVRADVAAPPGFRAGEPPPPVKFENTIGTYEWTASPAATGFHVERRLIVKALNLSPDGYDQVRSFFDDVARADRSALPFVAETAKP